MILRSDSPSHVICEKLARWLRWCLPHCLVAILRILRDFLYYKALALRKICERLRKLYWLSLFRNYPQSVRNLQAS